MRSAGRGTGTSGPRVCSVGAPSGPRAAQHRRVLPPEGAAHSPEPPVASITRPVTQRASSEARKGVTETRAKRGRPRTFDRAAALAVATRLFWERGYAATSVGEPTEAMGIRPGSLYAAFGDKKSLFEEAVHSCGSSPVGALMGVALEEEPTAHAAFARILREAAAIYPDPAHPAGCLTICAAANVSAQDTACLRQPRPFPLSPAPSSPFTRRRWLVSHQGWIRLLRHTHRATTNRSDTTVAPSGRVTSTGPSSSSGPSSVSVTRQGARGVSGTGTAFRGPPARVYGRTARGGHLTRWWSPSGPHARRAPRRFQTRAAPVVAPGAFPAPASHSATRASSSSRPMASTRVASTVQA